ncbi:hypothetical protein HDZ31DRAFT_60991 [Schizophyllum fasciatum]
MAGSAEAGASGAAPMLPSGRRRPLCSKCGTPMLGHKNGRKSVDGLLICPPEEASDVPIDLATSYPAHLQARTCRSAPQTPDKYDSASCVKEEETPSVGVKDSMNRLRTRYTLPQNHVLDFKRWPCEEGSPEQRTIAANDKLISVLDDVARHGGLYIMPHDFAQVQITSIRDLAARMGLFTRVEAVPAAYVEGGKSMFFIAGDRKEQVFAKDVVDRHLRLWDKNEMPGSIAQHRALEEKQVVRSSRPALVVDRFFNVLLFLFIVFVFGAAFAFYVLASG